MKKRDLGVILLVGAVAVGPCFGEDKKHTELRQPAPEPQLSYTVMMGTASAQAIPLFSEALDFEGLNQALAQVQSSTKFRIRLR
jgi:hypothetical protein